MLVRNLLKSAGHQVVDVSTGLEGIRTASVHHPDLILLDVNLPDLDGYEVTLRLRSVPAGKTVPIVMITREDDLKTAIAMGASGVIPVPIEGTRLVRTLERYLSGYQEHLDGAGELLLREQTQKIVERLELKVVELSALNAKLEEMARLRREFLQNVSHELATPMTPVVGYLRLLLNGDMGPLTPLQLKCLKSIESSTQRLRAVIDTLLDVSSLETGRMHFYERDYDFSTLAQKAIDKVRERFIERNISLIEDTASAELKGKGDPDKIQRAMIHILDNAAKFTPAGGEVAVKVRKEQDAAGSDVFCYVVADSGPGIAKDQLDTIFEPFYQIDGSITRSYGGVGLGLGFASRVSEAMGGRIEIQSPPTEVVAGRKLSGTALILRVAARPSHPAHAS